MYHVSASNAYDTEIRVCKKAFVMFTVLGGKESVEGLCSKLGTGELTVSDIGENN